MIGTVKLNLLMYVSIRSYNNCMISLIWLKSQLFLRYESLLLQLLDLILEDNLRDVGTVDTVGLN